MESTSDLSPALWRVSFPKYSFFWLAFAEKESVLGGKGEHRGWHDLRCPLCLLNLVGYVRFMARVRSRLDGSGLQL
eukprot:1084329-Amorphochlora_amoeboformis.AAC.1